MGTLDQFLKLKCHPFVRKNKKYTKWRPITTPKSQNRKAKKKVGAKGLPTAHHLKKTLAARGPLQSPMSLKKKPLVWSSDVQG
jgi:hypothetical protein